MPKNPEKGPGTLGAEGRGNASDQKIRDDQKIAKDLGKIAIEGMKGK